MISAFTAPEGRRAPAAWKGCESGGTRSGRRFLAGLALLLTTAACLLCLVLPAAGFETACAEETPAPARDDARKQRVVRVGWYEASGLFRSSEDGRVAGYVPAVLEALSRVTGWQYEWVQLEHDQIPAALASGKIDLSCDTDLRSQSARRKMRFSAMSAGLAILTIHAPQDSPLHFMDFADFTGKTFCGRS